MPTGRELVLDHVKERMTRAWQAGQIADAQNIERFVAALEEMTDAEYEKISSEQASGAIS